MKMLQVNTRLEDAIVLQRKLALLVKDLVEEMLEKPFETYGRYDIFNLRNALTEENVKEFLDVRQELWEPIHETLADNDFQGEKLFIKLFEKVNIHLHNVEGNLFVQFDYSKTIGRWWNLLSENSRGIVFRYPEMEVLSLPFHKFYNLNERPHTQLHALNLNQPIHIMEKLDGSMIHVFEHSGELYTATRGAIHGFEFNQKAKRHLLTTTNVEAVLRTIQNGYTPIFELLLQEGDENALIVKYEKEELRLIAIRERETGHYVHPTELAKIADDFGVEAATFYHGMTFGDVIATQKNVKNMEGWVIYFEDGTMVKVKGEEYLSLLRPRDMDNKFKSKPQLMAPTVFKLMQENKLDDILANMTNAETKEAMEQMEATIETIIESFHTEARALYERHYSENRGDLARAVLAEKPNKVVQNLVFGLMSGSTVTIKWEQIEPFLQQNKA